MREFARILIQNYFCMSCFIFSVSILRVEGVRVIVWGKFSPGLNCLGDIPMVGGSLPPPPTWRWGQISVHYLENDQKLYLKKQVVLLKVRSDIKT